MGCRNAYPKPIKHTVFGWDGDTLAFESTTFEGPGSANQQADTVHYIHEAGSFVPLMQARRKGQIKLKPTTDVKALMAANEGRYDIELDPLWNDEADNEPEAFDAQELIYYQCDHLGTPREMTDCEGTVAWEANYKAWGLAKIYISDAARKAGIKNHIRFQGQYYDEETGLCQNRYRYYDPHSGRFVSKDPIGLYGGENLYSYAPNSTGWVDALGLKKHCGKVYRAVTQAQEEQVASNKALLPKNVNNPHTTQEHVENGRNRTQFISTSRSMSRAQFYAKKNNATIVEIDLCKIPDNKIVDLSNGDGLVDNPQKRQFAKSWAIKDKEVLIRGPIPPSAYRAL